MNLLASALSFWGHRPIRQAFERDTISVPLEIVGILLLQCATAHAVGALLARRSKTESLASGVRAERFSEVACGIQAVFFIALGVLAVIGP